MRIVHTVRCQNAGESTALTLTIFHDFQHHPFGIDQCVRQSLSNRLEMANPLETMYNSVYLCTPILGGQSNALVNLPNLFTMLLWTTRGTVSPLRSAESERKSSLLIMGHRRTNDSMHLLHCAEWLLDLVWMMIIIRLHPIRHTWNNWCV